MKRHIFPLFILLAVVIVSSAFAGGPQFGIPFVPPVFAQVLWEDLRFPATALNLAGAPAAPGVNTTTYYGALSFAGNQVNDIACLVQMPHGWTNATLIYPHIHVVNGSTSTATSTWEFWYRLAEASTGDFPATWTVATTSHNLTASTARHSMIGFPAVNMAGFTDSAMMDCMIRRLGTIDAHNDVINLLEFDIHYQHDAFGSAGINGDH